MTNTPEPATDFIDAAYQKLEGLPDFRARVGQRELSRAISESFLNNLPLIGEAPTGTGKSIAYLIGALSAARAFRQQGTPKHIVVSTGTKALQGQLVAKDLPKLVAAGVLAAGDFVLAKGRGNYLCVSNALDVVAAGELIDMGGDSDEGVSITAREVTPLLDEFQSGVWDGDFDTFRGRRPRTLEPLRVNPDTCTRQKCANYRSCSYFKMKRALPDAQIVVANHNLVLLDLQMAHEESGEPTLGIPNYLAVFDEGHHLPEKALLVGSTEANLTALQHSWSRLRFFRKAVISDPGLMKALEAQNLTLPMFETGRPEAAVRDLMAILQRERVDRESGQCRYPRGVVPARIAEAIQGAQDLLAPFQKSLAEAVAVLQSAAQGEMSSTKKCALEGLSPAQKVLKSLSDCVVGLGSFLTGAEVVKWLYVSEKAIVLNTSPLEGAAVLKPLLWDGSRARAAVLSATLQDLNGFARFQGKSGFPDGSRTIALDYSFPYHLSTLTVAGMRYTPKQGEREDFVEELKSRILRDINPEEASLIPFPSRKMMNEVVPVLKAYFGEDMVLVQGEMPIKSLVDEHIARIDAGLGSILCGLQTMAEGLDLPGKYCVHVGIITLPFAVPTDAVEQEIQERMGSRYFMERSVPDALIRLIQAVGRLLRTEDDRGRVTVYDRRLASTFYGQKMLKRLPPYRVIIEPVAPKK